ncbi:DUF5999 family protein [Streptomyces sp. NPDC091266]|uniref:DUF5999 family protein n=1 Tax=Streptomyces sp. NPDC091266 TaxID=3365978 RepID=UPI003823138F
MASSAVPGVPWIATWDSERSSTVLLEATPGMGLRWFNEGPGDRDKRGGLWARKTQRIGQGKAEYAGIHPRRQPAAMEYLLCQVCGNTSSVTPEGALWLEPITPGDPLLPYSTHPPACLPCAIESRDRCKRILRTGAHVARVANPRPWGVLGTRYEIDASGRLVPGEPAQVGYDDPAVSWVLASQMVMYLDGMTEVDLDEEYARYLATDPEVRPAATRSTPRRRRPSQSACPADTTPAAQCPVRPGPDRPVRRTPVCSHTPTCPRADAPDADAAHPISTCFEQGWTVLCNGVMTFDDTGEIHPDLTITPPRRDGFTNAREKTAA